MEINLDKEIMRRFAWLHPRAHSHCNGKNRDVRGNDADFYVMFNIRVIPNLLFY